MMHKFNDGNGKSFRCPILEGKDNYDVWASTMKAHHETIEAYDIVFPQTEIKSLFALSAPGVGAAAGADGSAASPTQTNTAQKDREAKSALCSTLSENETRRIMHCQTARKIWACLENAYGMKTSNAKLELMTELWSFKCKSAREVPLVANKILGIKGKLSALGITVDDALVISSIIRALPESLRGFLDYWRFLDADQQSLDRFINKLNEKAKAISESEGSRDESAMVVVRPGNLRGRAHSGRPGAKRQQLGRPSNQQRPLIPSKGHRAERPELSGQINYRPAPQPQRLAPASNRRTAPSAPQNLEQIECYYCKHIGHYKSECQKPKSKLEREGAGQGFNFGHQARMAVVARPASAAQRPLENNPASTWVLNSAAASHMTCNRQWLAEYHLQPEPVTLVDGR